MRCPASYRLTDSIWCFFLVLYFCLFAAVYISFHFDSKTIYFFAVQWFIFTFAEIYASFFLSFSLNIAPVYPSVRVYSQLFFAAFHSCCYCCYCCFCSKNRKFKRLNRFFSLIRQKMQWSIVIGYEIRALCTAKEHCTS